MSSSMQISINFSSTFTLPEAIEFQIDPTLRLSFGFGMNGPTRTWPQIEMSMRQKTYLDIIPTEPQDLEYLLKKLREVADLLSLGIGIPLAISSLEGRFAIPEQGPSSQWADIIVGGINESAEEGLYQSKVIFT